MTKIVVVPQSAIVVRRPEHPFQRSASSSPAPYCTRFGKRGVIFPNISARSEVAGLCRRTKSVVQRFLRRSTVESTTRVDRTDGIFDAHARSEHRERRHRRRAEEREGKKSGPSTWKPTKSPPAPTDPLLQKYDERQAEWKKRSMALNNKQKKDPSRKRWSLRTWKADSGRDPAPRAKGHSRSKSDSAAKPLPQPAVRRPMSLNSQRSSIRPSTERLEVLRGRKVQALPPFPRLNHAASDSRVNRQSYNMSPHGARKAASTRSLRQQVAFDDRPAVPARHHALGPLDERYIHPAFRTQPPNLHPSRVRTPSGQPPLVQPQDPPVPVPRVRVIPPSIFIQAHDLPPNHTIQPTKCPSKQELNTLLESLNSIRASVRASPLDLEPILSIYALEHAALRLVPLPPAKPLPLARRSHSSSTSSHSRLRATQIEEVYFRNPSGWDGTRLISPQGLGALGCGELWAGGKYKRHKTVKRGHSPSQHRFTMLPGFELNARDSVASEDSAASTIHGSASWCGCAEWDAWKAVTDGRWKCCGIGRVQDGRWIVELWEPDGGQMH